MPPAIRLTKFRSAVASSAEEKTSHLKETLTEPQPYNPYLAGRREWDERYGGLVDRAKTSGRIALISGAVSLSVAAIAITLALRGQKIIPIPVDPAGHYMGTGSPARSIVVTESMKRSALSDWVIYLRTVTSDDFSQRRAIEKVYAMISSGSAAQTVVSDFYRSDPPQARAQRVNVQIEVNSILPTSDTTCEVEWTETTRDPGGRIVSQQRWKGIFTFIIRGTAPADERQARLNPFGLYVTGVSWSRVL